MRHTPGPWEVLITEAWKGVPGLTSVRTSEKEKYLTIADKIGPTHSYRHPENLANAQLIAAAPELLESLKDLLAWANIQDHHSQQAVNVRNAAGAAIAKATGRF